MAVSASSTPPCAAKKSLPVMVSGSPATTAASSEGCSSVRKRSGSETAAAAAPLPLPLPLRSRPSSMRFAINEAARATA